MAKNRINGKGSVAPNGTGATAEPDARRKAECPITRGEFREHAESLDVQIGDRSYTAEVKEFSTGSLGWHLNGKHPAVINGKRCTVQIGLNLTLVGSKELPKD